MRIEYARISAVIVDFDILVVPLENHPCMTCVAAPQRSKTAAQPLVRDAGFPFIHPVSTILQGQIELSHIMYRKTAGAEIFPIDIIRRCPHPRRIRRRQRDVQHTLRVKIDKLASAVFNCLLSILTRDIHIARDIRLSVPTDTLGRIDVYRALLSMDGMILLRAIRILGSRHRAAADIDHAVRADCLQHAALDILNIYIALNRNLGLIACRLERSQISSIVCPLVFRVHAVSPYRLYGEVAINRDIARGADGARCLNRRRIIPLCMNILDCNRPLDIDMGIRLRLDAVRRTRIRIRRLDGQRLFCAAVHNLYVLVVSAVNRTGNLVLTV